MEVERKKQIIQQINKQKKWANIMQESAWKKEREKNIEMSRKYVTY